MTLWCEAAAHLLEIDLGDVNEPTHRVEAPLEEQSVPVGVPATKGSRRLEGPAGCLGCEGAHQGVDEATDLTVEPLVVAEEDAQDLRDARLI